MHLSTRALETGQLYILAPLFDLKFLDLKILTESLQVGWELQIRGSNCVANR